MGSGEAEVGNQCEKSLGWASRVDLIIGLLVTVTGGAMNNCLIAGSHPVQGGLGAVCAPDPWGWIAPFSVHLCCVLQIWQNAAQVEGGQSSSIHEDGLLHSAIHSP